MKSTKVYTLIRFAPDKSLPTALGAAVLSFVTSALMNLTDAEIIRVILRQFVQVIGISLVFPSRQTSLRTA